MADGAISGAVACDLQYRDIQVMFKKNRLKDRLDEWACICTCFLKRTLPFPVSGTAWAGRKVCRKDLCCITQTNAPLPRSIYRYRGRWQKSGARHFKLSIPGPGKMRRMPIRTLQHLPFSVFLYNHPYHCNVNLVILDKKWFL